LVCPHSFVRPPDITVVVAEAAADGNAPAASLLDFEGVLLGGALGASADTVTLVPLAIGDVVVSFTADLAFSDGDDGGTLVATHSASLDG